MIDVDQIVLMPLKAGEVRWLLALCRCEIRGLSREHLDSMWAPALIERFEQAMRHLSGIGGPRDD